MWTSRTSKEDFYIQSKVEKILLKSNIGLYLLRNLNRKQTGKVKKNIIGVFKDNGFILEIETNLKEVDFVDVLLNLQNGTYHPYKKPSDRLLYIHSLINHPPNVIQPISNTV